MLHPEEVEKIKNALLSSERPFFLFHDDPDGLASFLLFYRFVQRGRGHVVKAIPRITGDYVERVKTYGADAVFILDIAIVEQEFIDSVGVPVYWIDHHQLVERKNVFYFNPRRDFGNIPTPSLCYQIVEQDLWIAVIGCIGDWYWPEKLISDFRKDYPDILPDGIEKVEDALLSSPAGKLIKVFSFIMKGKTSDVLNSIKIFTRIESPYEILRQETSRGKFLFKYYEKINSQFTNLLSQAVKRKSDDKILLFTYTSDSLSLTKDVANELIAMFSDKIIILGREKDDELRCSLRSGKNIRLDKIFEKALVGINGYGGGHEQACGAAIKKFDFDRFVDNLRKSM